MTQCTPATLPLDVVVVDDNARFALHVWRYLSRSIGFGIGDVATDGGRLKDLLLDGLLTPAGDGQVWWVPLDEIKNKGRLQALGSKLTNDRKRVFLLDVRGPHRSKTEGLGEEYTWKVAVKRLKAAKIFRSDDEIKLVSSYEVQSMETEKPDNEEKPNEKIEFWAKTPEYLDRLASRLWRLVAPENVPSSEESGSDLHILITGAGFELTSTKRAAFSPLGIPGTGEVLEHCLQALGLRPIRTRPKNWPAPNVAGYSGTQKLAGQKDLDEYCNVLLKRILEDMRGLATLRKEGDFRRLFRQEFLTHDWGILNQSLDAIRLHWAAWLTTNYTRFLDRALALVAAHESQRDSDEREPGWNVVSISGEATLLLKQILHDEGGPGASNASTRQESSEGDRYLFKLHGDVAHLTTMAIAGHDKEIYTPLSLPVDSLHWVYVAAQQHLMRKINGHAGQVVWHIVGHSLKDKLLRRLLLRVHKATPKATHRFIVVTPFEKENQDVLKRLKKSLDLKDRKTKTVFVRERHSADQWLAMLAKNGMSGLPPVAVSGTPLR